MNPAERLAKWAATCPGWQLLAAVGAIWLPLVIFLPN